MVKNKSDFRKESFRPRTHDTEIRIIGEIKPDGDAWKDRREIVLKKVYTNLKTLISEAKNEEIGTSLAVFKPAEILKLEIKNTKREWDKDKLERLSQLNLFETKSEGKLEVLKKLPYKFSYKLKDETGTESSMMIEDWEIGQLYWNSLKRHKGDEKKACQDVRKKYIDDFAKTKDKGVAYTGRFEFS